MFCTVGMPLGEYVAFTHSAWRTRPLIGKAEHIKRRYAFTGGREATPLHGKPSNKQQGRQTVLWVEEIPTENIITPFHPSFGQVIEYRCYYRTNSQLFYCSGNSTLKSEGLYTCTLFHFLKADFNFSSA